MDQIIPGALYVCNHSGGKDSQAMYLMLKKIIPADQLVVIHANLPGVEWHGTLEHIEQTIEHELYVVSAKKTFLGMVEQRGYWPSPKYRQCTSDLKRDPINSQVIKIANERGFATVVNCTGIRAEESSARSKQTPWKVNNRQTNSKRTWYEWMPIFNWSKEEVFGFIASNGQAPHWAYGKGMSRLSCCFCIMSSKKDLQIAASLNPELLARYVALEKKIDQTFMMPGKDGQRRFLDELVSSPAMA